MSFQVYISSIFWGNHNLTWSKTISTEAEGTHGDAPPKTKKELQAFLLMINYLGKFSP